MDDITATMLELIELKHNKLSTAVITETDIIDMICRLITDKAVGEGLVGHKIFKESKQSTVKPQSLPFI